MPLLISEENYLIHKGKRINVEDVVISQSRDGWYWAGSVTLLSLTDFGVMRQNDAVTLYLQGDVYQLIIENRSISKQGVDHPTLTLRLASPTLPLSYQKISQTLVGMNALAAAEIITGTPIDWQIVNWFIPEGLLAFENATKIEALKHILNAVKAVLQTTKTGQLKVIYRYPFPVPQWNFALAQAIISSGMELGFSEDYNRVETYNAVVISAAEPERQISLEYTKETEVTGKLRVYCEPWIESTDLTVECTGHPSITIGHPQIKVQNVCEEACACREQVEFQEGRATVKYPIYMLQEIQWQHRNLNPVIWKKDKRELTATGGLYSIAQVKYSTRFWEYPIHHAPLSPAEATQFVVTQKYTRSDAVTCIRYQGDIFTEEINEPLCCTLQAKLACGRNVLDDGEPLIPIEDSFVYLPNISVGDLVAVHGFMPRYVAQVLSIEHSLTSEKQLITKLSLIRRTDE